MKRITITLTSKQVQLAYDAVHHCVKLDNIVPLLEILDVSEFKDEYDFNLVATNFENIRIAINEFYKNSTFDKDELLILLQYMLKKRDELVG